MWQFEHKALTRGYMKIAGVDEAGRGPLAGPVVSAAVILPHDFSLVGIDDSKKLSEKKRNTLFPQICDQAIAVATGSCSHKEIDQINILQASLLSMKRAVENLSIPSELAGSNLPGSNLPGSNLLGSNLLGSNLLGSNLLGSDLCCPDYLLVDGKFTIDTNIDQEAIIKGDSKSISIAAASIIAKVTRDSIMKGLHEIYPQYNFVQHKGYPTKAHKGAILKHGPCPYHRRTFKGVKEVVNGRSS